MGKSLLILGAGGHGNVVREVAQAMMCNQHSIYSKIEFLDDESMIAIGKLDALESIGRQYDEIFCGIGNNNFRQELLLRVQNMGKVIPILIHPTAYVSPSANIKFGTVIEPMAIINARAIIEEGAIISVGAIVDHDAYIESYSHVNAGAICKAGSRVASHRKLEAGEVVRGY